MIVSVRYFAALRERRGLDAERLDTSAGSPSELYRELSARHNLQMDPSLVRFAMNGDFVSPDAPLAEGAELALIPPVAGG
jgi:molybdopterin converting factor subunit 1